MKKGFTLAEIMIVLSVIAVLTAILLPAARNAMPNEKVMKFKKGHNTLYTTISELVNSDKYYLDGDLGIKADGSLVNSATYLCETIADTLNAQNADCPSFGDGNGFYVQFGLIQDGTSSTGTLEEAKNKLDEYCKRYSNSQIDITLNDNVLFYQTSSKAHFGITWAEARNLIADSTDSIYDFRQFGHHLNPNGFDRVHKIYCIDIDGLNQGEDPFGYGIRADGKILNGARADEWLNKTIQDKD